MTMPELEALDRSRSISLSIVSSSRDAPMAPVSRRHLRISTRQHHKAVKPNRGSLADVLETVACNVATLIHDGLKVQAQQLVFAVHVDMHVGIKMVLDAFSEAVVWVNQEDAVGVKAVIHQDFLSKNFRRLANG